MKLFYTTTQKQDVEQLSKELSLGGCKSSTSIINSNIFPPISITTEERLLDEYIALILWNDTLDVAENVELWFDYPKDELGIETNLAKIEIGAISLDSNNKMNTISNIYSKPSGITFYEANGIENSVGLGNIEPSKGLGIWFKRSLIKDRVLLKKSNDVLYDNFVKKSQPITVEDINLTINWGLQYYGGDLGVNNF